MSSVEKRVRNGKTVWRAHYRAPDGRQRNKSFPRKIDADRFLTTIDSAKLSGSYLDPSLRRISLGDWIDEWFAGQAHLKPSTRERYAAALREHVVPRWGSYRLGDVTHSEIQSWVSQMALTASPATTQKTFGVLRRVLDLAVRDGRLPRNPADGVNLPRVKQGQRRYLTHSQVQAVADSCVAYRLVVLVLAYTGMRFGELAAMRVRDIDLMRRRAAIVASVTEVNGRLDWGLPKTHQHREVPLPRFLIDDLVGHLAGRTPDDLAFAGRTGATLRVRVFRGPFEAAVAASGLPPLRPHDLRHTAASLAIASGANVKVVQQMLGHASAVMTLDLYGHLFPDQLDDVADRLDEAARRATVAPVLPSLEADLTRLDVQAAVGQ